FTDIAGATSSSFLTSAGMEGDQLRLVVTDTETSGTFVTTDTFTTTPAVTVQEFPNDMTRSEERRVGEDSRTSGSRNTDNNTSDALNDPGQCQQWQRDPGSGFTDIAGATSSSFLTSAGMEGDQLRLVVTDTETSGTFVTTDTFTTTPAVTVQEFPNDMTATIAATAPDCTPVTDHARTPYAACTATND